MTRHAHLRTGLMLFLLAVTGCAKPTLEDRLKPLQGEWTVLQFNQAGNIPNDEALMQMSVTIENDHLQFLQTVAKGATQQRYLDESLLQIDPSKPAGQVDIVYLVGKDTGKTRPGIYSVEGDQLKLCFGEIDSARPTEFVAKEEPPVTLVILQRKQ